MPDAQKNSNADLVDTNTSAVAAAIAAEQDAEKALAEAHAAVEAAEAQPLREDGPTLEEYVAAGYDAEGYPPAGYAERLPKPVFIEFSQVETEPTVVDQHADSGYRPVTGSEVQDYLRAKGMGLEGRPSKDEVVAFLASKV